jgi:hypothetical protein
MTAPEKDPRFGAAMLKVAFLTDGPAPGYREIFEGTLRDLGLTEAEVDRYIAEHKTEIEEACRKLPKPGGKKGD